MSASTGEAADAAGTVSQAQKDDAPGLGLWDRLSFSLAHFTATLLLKCLTPGGLYVAARWLGTGEWLINHKRRRRFSRALSRLLGDSMSGAERRRWTREHFMQTRCDKLFYLIFDRIPRAKAETLLTIGNRAQLDESLAQGRGVYMAMSHHGAHHVAGMLLAVHGYKPAAVRDRKEGAMRRFVQARFDLLYPEFGRMRIIFADAYPREIYRCLKDGYVLGSAMDVNRSRNPKQKTETVTIFGEQRAFLSGPLHVAIRCKTPILQAFLLPGPGFRYHFEIVPLVTDTTRVEDEAAAVRETMQAYADNVARYLRERPSLLSRA